MTKNNKDKKIEFNNGNKVVENLEGQQFEEEVPMVRLRISGTSEFPHITEKNIKNNSKFIVDLFDPDTYSEEPKTYVKK